MAKLRPVIKLVKCRATIRRFLARGGTLSAVRGLKLVDRYNELRSLICAFDRPAWNAYCEEIGADPTHDGYDLFA